MNCFPSAVVLFYVCVHKMFSCPRFREEKSPCVIILNMPVVFCFQEENRTAVKQSNLAKRWPKTRQRQWLWAAVCGGMRSQLWQAASTRQGLGKYQHMKRCLQLCKHHVHNFSQPQFQKKAGKVRERSATATCNPTIANHGYGRAGQLPTVAL